MTKLNDLLGGAALGLAAMLGATSASADWCNDEVTVRVDAEVSARFNAATANLRAAIAALEAAGLTGTPVYNELKAVHDGTWVQAQSQANGAKAQAIGDCREQLEAPQFAMDALVAGATGGISLILPPDVTHIDVGAILDGDWDGGDNSVVSHIGDAFDALGDGLGL